MGNRALYNIAAIIILILLIFNGGRVGCWLFVLFLLLCAVRVAVAGYRSYCRYRQNNSMTRQEYIVKLTARLMGLCFISGTLIYMVTFSTIRDYFVDPVLFNNTELIIRSMICSLDMFMLDVDSNILDRVDLFPLLKGVIAVQAAFSFMCTVTLILSLILSRARAYWLLHYKTHITIDCNHLYLFYGVNENSRLLAADIKTHDPAAITVFIDVTNVNNEDNDSWGVIVNLFTHRRSTFETADDAGALVAIASKPLDNLDFKDISADGYDIFSMIGLEKIKSFIEELKKVSVNSKLYIFFLSDNEDENIRSLISLSQDKLLQELARNRDVEHSIYCHARYNGPNRVVEDIAVHKMLNVEIVDSSQLAVEILKSRPDCQPVRFVSLSDTYPTTITDRLNALIVGFGEVGRDAFRFLYEYGTFIQVKNGVYEECIPSITAIDNRMSDLEGSFISSTPGISYSEESGLQLLNLNYNNIRFYNEILSPQKCEELNYIVLALGDDDSNISLAINIFNRIRRYRCDMSGLVIMVRCVEEDKLSFMKQIAEHYNQGCGKETEEVIRIFGSPREIYSYNTIIKDHLRKQGRIFFSNYQRIRREKGSWQGRRAALLGQNIKRLNEGNVVPLLDNLRRLRRQETQDLTNALHASTKIWLLKQVLLPGDSIESFKKRLFDENMTSTREGFYTDIFYPLLDHESALLKYNNQVMLNLARLEHARWNASHQLLGYVINDKSSKCIERTLSHNCLRHWDLLDDESKRASSDNWICDYKSYDFSVVETSIALNI